MAAHPSTIRSGSTAHSLGHQSPYDIIRSLSTGHRTLLPDTRKGALSRLEAEVCSGSSSEPYPLVPRQNFRQLDHTLSDPVRSQTKRLVAAYARSVPGFAQAGSMIAAHARSVPGRA
eukprot:3940419-Rhodomonas_salina.5